MDSASRLNDFKNSFEGISLLTGEDFFRELVKGISIALQVEAVWVAELHKGQNSMTTLAFMHRRNYLPSFTYLLDNTPCERVINSATLVHYSERIVDLFPRDEDMLSKFRGESYVGSALHDANGAVIGNLAILDTKPIAVTDDITTIIKIIKSRAEAELQRLRKEKAILQQENLLRGLINGVKDLLINLDHQGKIVMLNAEAESTLNVAGGATDSHISQFLTDSSKSKLLDMIENLGDRKANGTFLWIPEYLELKPKASQSSFRAEGTLSRYELDERIYYTLVLRNKDNQNDSVDGYRQLADETEYLRSEFEEISESNELVGESSAMKKLLQNVYMVAHTDATVLIHGETGTGKELVARHIHQISNRKSKPFVAVNCGAIPATLMESEFFGHAKGAFTGATSERKGRFQLADGGTIFLDEIGELPLDLQVKLLRVIQEGELEQVGSSKTIKVDVRIVAATHRNLPELIKEKKFREDLYYRLNVFPIEVPPLCDRGNDVVILANTFINKFARRNGKKISQLNDEQASLLRAHRWPGNIRELQNVVERAVILSANGTLDLRSSFDASEARKATSVSSDHERILTKDEFLEFERQNIIRALKVSGWKVSGKNGAAALLHMVPSTLSSRIAALGIKAPKE